VSGIDVKQMLIYNVGLFWNAEKVNWGRRGKDNDGQLRGILARKKTSQPVEFREQIGIYVLYSNFKIIYVGQTGGAGSNQKLFARLKQHRHDHTTERWDRFSWFGIRPVNQSGHLRAEKKFSHPTIETILNHIEGILIYSSEPPLNRQAGRFGGDVDFYLQNVDDSQPDGV
jgi:hypothetical protein